ncbi:hypothetical protein QBC32DRAFT_269937 [Pseudoneurospora amorphoporcata]|uniref:JmjC domain-containing protein n=1 Tax=Pseudoneurospora amorphoporcata TaxID=241081 RepID=A0AAN6NL84_9PEZI|nr:hypothetical protein QBC32DRAFT_269937 [Pseudoneurospora amorphoporcata]
MEALKSEIESIKLQIQHLCNFAETNLQNSTPSSSSTQTNVISSAIQQVLEVLNRIDNKLNELTTASSKPSISLPSIRYLINTTGPHPIPNFDKIGHHTFKPLTKDDLGLNLIANLHELETDPHFRGKVCVSIADLGIDWKDLPKRTLPLPDHNQFAVQHNRDDDGFSRLYLSHSKTMIPINFDFDLNPLTDDEAKQFLQDIVESPPQNTIPYYVGPIDTSGTPLASLFPSGALSILGDLPGINTLYMHMGERGSGTAFHCEDAQLRSYNLNIFGWKLWIMIDPNDTTKFERMLATKWALHKCDQSVRHLNIMVSPKRLLEEGIRFDIIRAGPGDLVITRPRQYHAVINQTPSLAIATNFTLLSEEAIPRGWLVCPEDGFYGLSHGNLKKLSHGPLTKKRKLNATFLLHSKRQSFGQSRTKGKTSTKSIVTTRMAVITATMPLTLLSDTHTNTDIESGRQLASLTIDNGAILRFISIVYAWDSADVTLKSSFASRKPTDELSAARHYDSLRRKAQNLSILYTVLGMSASFRLSKVMKENQYRHRASGSSISAVLAGRGIEDTPKARKAFTTEISEARKIMKMVEGYDGLLCFLPLGFGSGFTLRALKRFSDKDVETFRATIARYESLMLLSEVGNEFLLSVWGEGEFKERLFQRRQLSELQNLPNEDLIKLLTPIQPEDGI